jgi:hypothetical protein
MLLQPGEAHGIEPGVIITIQQNQPRVAVPHRFQQQGQQPELTPDVAENDQIKPAGFQSLPDQCAIQRSFRQQAVEGEAMAVELASTFG